LLHAERRSLRSCLPACYSAAVPIESQRIIPSAVMARKRQKAGHLTHGGIDFMVV